jgi:hypothetical protein
LALRARSEMSVGRCAGASPSKRARQHLPSSYGGLRRA